jgi:hypothetical protein
MYYDWSSRGSTYSAVVPLTNLFGLYQIPAPEPDQLMFPINLVLFQMMSEVVRYEIKNFITWTLDFENWHKKIRVGSYANEHEQRPTDPGSCRPQWETVQVDLVEVEVPGPQTSGPPTDNAI